MAGKRVMVYMLKEVDRLRALAAIPNADITDGYVVGEASDVDIDQLRNAGITVQVLPEYPPVPLGSRFKTLDFDGSERVPLPGYYLALLPPPLLPSHQTELAQLGLRVLERRGDWHLFYCGDLPQLEGLSQLPFVRGVKPYEADDRLPPPTASPTLTAYWDVRLHPEADYEGLLEWLGSIPVELVERGPRKLRVIAGADAIGRLVHRDEVAEVVRWTPPRLRLDRARALLGTVPPALLANATTLTGKGVVVGVCDSGIDLTHGAFTGANIAVIARGAPGGPDTHGHGTHVTGIIAGGGHDGGPAGVAPSVQIVFQSVMGADGALTGLPLDLNDLLQEAWNHEVRIHNDSWGADTQGTYTLSSREVDQFVWNHPEMLVVIAAGNDGTCLSPPMGNRRAQPGFVEWYSVNAPGSAKNALVVGACRSDRTHGGWSTLTHKAIWPKAFPDKPIAEDHVSGDSEEIAGFSSRGPIDGQRIRPDVVAPGTDIAAPRASTAPAHHFAGVLPGTRRKYGLMSGTSMAAPMVTGLAALVREYVVTQRNHAPSAALLKAIIINGARPLTGPSATPVEMPGIPNVHQGFGCVSLPRSLPLDGSFTLAFVDDWKDPAKAFRLRSNGTRRRFKVVTDRDAPLRITLAYTDYYASGLQNNLNLIVDVAGRQLPGNLNLGNPPQIGRIPDPENNVECLRLEPAPAGTYVISVIAANILEDMQHFALVVAGALTSDVLLEI